MRGAMNVLVVTAAMAVLCLPNNARAEGYISPFAGVHFGNAQFENNAVYGVNAGWMSAGVIGGEVDFGWGPNAFDEVVDNHVLDLMANLIVGVPVGGTRGPGLRPYVTGGLGLIQTKFSSGVNGVPDLDDKDFGFNLGAGAMGFFSNHVGLRGDLRYFRTVNSNDSDFDNIDFDLGNFDFWRASIGLVIR